MSAVKVIALITLALLPAAARSAELTAAELRAKFTEIAKDLNAETQDQAVRELRRRLAGTGLRLGLKNDMSRPLAENEISLEKLGTKTSDKNVRISEFYLCPANIHETIYNLENAVQAKLNAGESGGFEKVYRATVAATEARLAARKQNSKVMPGNENGARKTYFFEELGKEIRKATTMKDKRPHALYHRLGGEVFEHYLSLQSFEEKRAAGCAEIEFRSIESRDRLYGPMAFQVERVAHYVANFKENDQTIGAVFPQKSSARTWNLESCRDFAENTDGLDPFLYLNGHLNKTSLTCRDALGIERPKVERSFIDPVELERMAPISGR